MYLLLFALTLLSILGAREYNSRRMAPAYADAAVLRKLVDELPQGFGEVSVYVSTSGHAALGGRVETTDDYIWLTERVEQVFGPGSVGGRIGFSVAPKRPGAAGGRGGDRGSLLNSSEAKIEQ
jgi:hypothetical protein